MSLKQLMVAVALSTGVSPIMILIGGTPLGLVAGPLLTD
jgi:hypothetical protein